MPAGNSESAAASIGREPSNRLAVDLLRAPAALHSEQPIAPSGYQNWRFLHGLSSLAGASPYGFSRKIVRRPCQDKSYSDAGLRIRKTGWQHGCGRGDLLWYAVTVKKKED
jgi:hypothetical protein